MVLWSLPLTQKDTAVLIKNAVIELINVCAMLSIQAWCEKCNGISLTELNEQSVSEGGQLQVTLHRYSSSSLVQ